MSSFEPPIGTFPLVFESGVINLDENRVLHVHLTHSPDNPHPMLTHPNGEETTIPSTDSEVYLDGIEQEEIKILSGIRETENLPSGFIFHITGWRLLQLEMSGDLTVVMGEMQEIPDWFREEKVHRFDGPDKGVQLYKGSQSLSNPNDIRIPTPQSNFSKETQEYSTKAQDNDKKNKQQEAPNSGCGLFLFLCGMALYLGSTVLPLLT